MTEEWTAHKGRRGRWHGQAQLARGWSLDIFSM